MEVAVIPVHKSTFDRTGTMRFVASLVHAFESMVVPRNDDLSLSTNYVVSWPTLAPRTPVITTPSSRKGRERMTASGSSLMTGLLHHSAQRKFQKSATVELTPLMCVLLSFGCELGLRGGV